MRRLRRAARTEPRGAETREAFRGFERTVELVEEAKEVLLLGVPSGRPPRISLAEALLGFEEGLRRAADRMPAWRAEPVDDAWSACREAIEEALARAERLRLDPLDGGYEELVPAIDALLEPLRAFADAARRFRELGR